MGSESFRRALSDARGVWYIHVPRQLVLVCNEDFEPATRQVENVDSCFWIPPRPYLDCALLDRNMASNGQRGTREFAQVELAQLHRLVSDELDHAGWQFGSFADIDQHLVLDDILQSPRTTYSSRARRSSAAIRRNASASRGSMGSMYDVPSPRDSIVGSNRFSITTLPEDSVTILDPAEASVDQHSPAKEPERIIVGWDGEHDPENPFNWPAWRVNLNASLLIFLAFLIPLASCKQRCLPAMYRSGSTEAQCADLLTRPSAIIAPAVPQIMLEFRNDSPELAAFVVSVFVLGVSRLKGGSPPIFHFERHHSLLHPRF